jgi:hypothetical protein
VSGSQRFRRAAGRRRQYKDADGARSSANWEEHMKLTVEFKNDAGETRTVVFDDAASTATFNGAAAPYTRADNVITVDTPNGVMKLTLESLGREAGHTTRYALSNGEQGTARIVSMG